MCSVGKLKSAKEILEEIGFKKDAPESTQLSFYRFLKKNASSLQQPTPTISNPPEQLEFQLEDSAKSLWPQDPKRKKVSTR